MSPEIRQLLAIVYRSWLSIIEEGRQDEASTTAKFQGPSSPQLHIEYRIGRPVALRAWDMLLYRSKEMCGVPARPSL